MLFGLCRHGPGSKWEWAAADVSPADFGSDEGPVAVPERHNAAAFGPCQHSAYPGYLSTGTWLTADLLLLIGAVNLAFTQCH